MTRRSLRWIGLLAIFLALIPVVSYLNRPNAQRRETARSALADSGYPGARVFPAQRVANMARCQVGQVRNKGYAYAWETDSHSGVFCLPEDGRPSRILLDPTPAR